MSKKKDSDVNYSKRSCRLTAFAIILYSMTVCLTAGILAVSIKNCNSVDSSSDDFSEVEDMTEYESLTDFDEYFVNFDSVEESKK